MQRTVDHDQRRADIVRATWRIIARRGMAGATMRQIAHEAGFANGALKPYFPTKADLLMATYEYVFTQSNSRTRAITASLRGVDALTAVCREFLPLDAERLDEARVVIEFWSEAANDPAAKGLFERSMAEWKDSLLALCTEIDPGGSWGARVDALITFVQGAQVAGALMPSVNGSVEALEAQLDVVLREFSR